MARRAKTTETCSHCGSVTSTPRTDEAEGPQEDERWVFVGMTGTGKTTEHMRQIAEWRKRGRAVLAFDPHDEYSRHGKRRPKAKPGPLRDRATVWEVLKDPEILTTADLSLAVVPTWPTDDEEQLARVAKAIGWDLDDEGFYLDDLPGKAIAYQFLRLAPFVKARGDLILVLDELGDWAMATSAVAEKLNSIASGWRKDGVAVSAAMQFLTQAPAGFRSQVTRIKAGRQAKAAHLQLLAQETSPEFAARVRKAKKYQFFVVDVWDDDEPEHGSSQRKAA